MTIYKNEKRGTWYCIFRYHDYTGKNVQKKKEGFKLKRDAIDYEIDFKQRYSGCCNMSFKNLTQNYQDDVINRQKITTYSTNDNIIKTILLPQFGILPINEITPLMIRKWQNNQMGKYKISTIKSRSTLLSSIMKYAVKYYRLPDNPVQRAGTLIKAPKISEQEHLSIHYWTQKQFEQFNLHVKNQTMHLIFNILFYCGLRRGEVLGLRIKDIDLGNRIIHIRQNRVNIIGKEMTIQTPKTKQSVRDITCPIRINEEIRNYIDKLYKPDLNDLIFEKSPQAATSFLGVYNKLCK